MAKRSSSGLSIGKLIAFFWIGHILLILLTSFIGSIGSLFFDEEEATKIADGFTIDKYNVVLDVKEDNKIDVTENITINFTNGFKHGIYKFTPRWYKYTSKDGKTIKRKSNIIDYRSIGDPYSLDEVKKKARIKIGSAYDYVGEGPKDYTIKYTYDMGTDPFNGFDELIFHAFGDYWGTPINNASIEVNMPKSIEGYNVNFFTDKYRENNVNDLVDYEIKDNSLIAKFNEEKNYELQLKDYCSKDYNNKNGECDKEYFEYQYNPLSKSLTVDIELPEGYFTKGSWNYGYGSFITIMIVIALLIWTIVKWYKYGKDFSKREQTVEFYAPDNLSAAEIGYVYNKRQPTKKLTISLIIQLASKGYIKIDELDDKDKSIEITNLVPTPKKPADFESTLPKRTIVINKLKDADDNLQPSEKTMMDYLFKKGDNKSLDTNIDKFLEVRDNLVTGGYIEIVSDNEKTRLQGKENEKKLYEEKLNEYNKNLEEHINKVSKLPELTSFEKLVYDRLFDTQDIVLLSAHKTLYKAFDDVNDELKSTFKDKVHDIVATKQIAGAIIRNILIFILAVIAYRYIEDLDPKLNILYYLAFACIFINIFFTIIMKRKTEYGEVITARVKGFRHFLDTAEKEKLESLVSDDPHYFYNILPYTYVLGISKKWIKKFEDIPMPEVDMGSFDYSSDSAYSHIGSDLYRPAPVYTSSGGSSSGCSSCGGGCSSCGGGCSSCGGGGSW